MAERVLRMAEIEQEQRILNERTGLLAAIRNHSMGVFFGAVIAVVAIVAAVANTYLKGAWEVSVALVGVPVLSVAQALITGARNKTSAKDKDTE